MSNLRKVSLSYKQLYDLFGGGAVNKPYEVTESVFVSTPTGLARIRSVVKKSPAPLVRIDFDDGDVIECSEEHLFSCDGVPTSAIDVQSADATGGRKKIVLEKTPLKSESPYDIEIDSPHWYVAKAASGLIHHNTFFVLGIVKQFLDANPTGGVIYYDTEAAVTREMMKSRGIDTSRIILSEQSTIEEFRTHAMRVLDKYIESPKKTRPPLMMVLDSLGMLSTGKEVADMTNDKRNAEGISTRDMTRAPLIRGAFRALSLRLAKASVPMLVTNHTYDKVGSMFPEKEMSGGCLVADTKIITRVGLLDIQDVMVGDEVMTKEGVWREVLETHYFPEKDTLEIEFEDGFKVSCTLEHKFLIDGVWVEAKDLVEGNLVDAV